MNKIAVIGSINIDYFIKISEMPKIGETILSNNFNIKYGGKGANQAFNATILGSNVNLFSKVGNDLGINYLEELNKIGTNIENVEITNESTGIAIVMVDSKSDNSIIVSPNSNYLVDKKYIDKNYEKIKENDLLLIQNEIPLKTTKYILEKFKTMRIAYNFAPALLLEKEYFKYIDYLIVNEEELKFISKNIFYSNEEEAINEILNTGTKNILITCGKKGSIYINKDTRYEIEALKVKAVDTTGAGDSFIGSFLHKLKEDESNIKEALEFATKISSIVVSNYGTQIKEIGDYND